MLTQHEVVHVVVDGDTGRIGALDAETQTKD